MSDTDSEKTEPQETPETPDIKETEPVESRQVAPVQHEKRVSDLDDTVSALQDTVNKLIVTVDTFVSSVGNVGKHTVEGAARDDNSPHSVPWTHRGSKRKDDES